MGEAIGDLPIVMGEAAGLWDRYVGGEYMSYGHRR